jgi:dihydrolipoamide dehydrogenase
MNLDTITLGAGGGAYPAAFRLARAGRTVAMVDTKGVMSGNCLAEGCVPSKAVREVAAAYRRALRGEKMGLSGSVEVSYQRVLEHKSWVQRLRYQQHDAELVTLTDRLQLINGRAKLLDPHTVEVDSDGLVQRYSADSIVVATGSDISIPPIPGAADCITSRDLFALEASLTQLPERLIVVGAGYIGLEVASMLHTFGVEVEVLEMADQILPGMDPRFASLLASLLDPGIKIRLGARVDRIDPGPVGHVVAYTTAGGAATATADEVLMSVGRHPVLPEGLADIGVAMEHGRPVISLALQTNLPHIYAAGDVNGRSMLFHSAVRQSLAAANCILTGNRPSDYVDFDAIPTTIFTFPEAAYVGLLPASAHGLGVDLLEASYSFEEDSRAQIIGEMEGEVRLFFAPGSLRLLGGWVVGIDAANLIGEIGTGVAAGLTAHQLARFADQHPMASEGIGKAARRLV